MNSEDIRLDLERMRVRVKELEGAPESQITAAARREAEAIGLPLPESTLRAWVQAVHHGDEFRFRLR
jgi:hypothetical protein